MALILAAHFAIGKVFPLVIGFSFYLQKESASVSYFTVPCHIPVEFDAAFSKMNGPIVL